MGEELPTITEEDRMKANKGIVDQLQGSLRDGRAELVSLRYKLGLTYWGIISLSIIMFFLGVALMTIPGFAAFNMTSTGEAAAAAAFGIADLTALFLFRPIERIHRLMGDMCQIVVALNSYQMQIGLRLMEMDSDDRASIGKTAEHVNDSAKDSIKLVQDYFEAVAAAK